MSDGSSGKTTGERVGYIRVSVDQNTGRQLEGVELDKTFTDKASGKDVKRPQLQAALEYLEMVTCWFYTTWIVSPETLTTFVGS
jgi:hypothetical protein